MDSPFRGLKLPSYLTTVTRLSKTLAAILFITMPFAGFYFGQKNANIITTYFSNSSSQPSPTQAVFRDKTTSITDIQFLESCRVAVKRHNSVPEIIDVPGLFDKTCTQTAKPVVSPDGKYAVFELRGVTLDPGNGSYGAENSLYVYFVSHANWANVYSFGAAGVDTIEFDQSGSVIIKLLYPDLDSYWKIPISDIEQEFDQIVDPLTHQLLRVSENTRVQLLAPNSISSDEAIEIVRSLPQAQNRLYSTSADSAGSSIGDQPSIVVESRQGDDYVIRVEFIESDTLQPTITWYRVNSTTGLVKNDPTSRSR